MTPFVTPIVTTGTPKRSVLTTFEKSGRNPPRVEMRERPRPNMTKWSTRENTEINRKTREKSCF